jgi:hypothetical protein
LFICTCAAPTCTAKHSLYARRLRVISLNQYCEPPEQARRMIANILLIDSKAATMDRCSQRPPLPFTTRISTPVRNISLVGARVGSRHAWSATPAIARRRRRPRCQGLKGRASRRQQEEAAVWRAPSAGLWAKQPCRAGAPSLDTRAAGIRSAVTRRDPP